METPESQIKKEELTEDLNRMQAITKIICERLQRESSISQDNKESIAYRMAEIMLAAKYMYTKILPDLTDEDSKETPFELLSRFRLHYLNLYDIIQEFDEIFINSIITDKGAEYIEPNSEDDDLYAEDMEEFIPKDENISNN